MLSLVYRDLFLFVGSAMCVLMCVFVIQVSVLRKAQGLTGKTSSHTLHPVSQKGGPRHSGKESYPVPHAARLTLGAVFQDAAILSIFFVPAITSRQTELDLSLVGLLSLNPDTNS